MRCRAVGGSRLTDIEPHSPAYSTSLTWQSAIEPARTPKARGNRGTIVPTTPTTSAAGHGAAAVFQRGERCRGAGGRGHDLLRREVKGRSHIFDMVEAPNVPLRWVDFRISLTVWSLKTG